MIRTYYGCSIFRNDSPGYRLRWQAYCDGRFVSADTLAGIKSLIRDTLKNV